MKNEDIEELLNHAMDLMADFRDEEAAEQINDLIAKLKTRMDGTLADVDRHYFWGRALSLLEEREQALLRFEKVLQLQGDHEGALWETVSLLLFELQRPEGAKTILEESLMPLRPGYPLYEEALANAKALIRIQTSKPSRKGGEEDEELDLEFPEGEAEAESLR